MPFDHYVHGSGLRVVPPAHDVRSRPRLETGQFLLLSGQLGLSHSAILHDPSVREEQQSVEQVVLEGGPDDDERGGVAAVSRGGLHAPEQVGQEAGALSMLVVLKVRGVARSEPLVQGVQPSQQAIGMARESAVVVRRGHGRSA